MHDLSLKVLPLQDNIFSTGHWLDIETDIPLTTSGPLVTLLSLKNIQTSTMLIFWPINNLFVPVRN